MPTFKLQIGDETREYEVVRQGEMLRLRHDDGMIELRLLHGDGRSFQFALIHPDGRQQIVRAAGVAQGDGRQMWVNGRSFTSTRVRRRAGNATNAGSLAAAIPAIVSEILVRVGDTVQAGDKLILLESMKMVIPIQAPHDGTVAAINVTAGESVAAGVPLLALSEDN